MRISTTPSLKWRVTGYLYCAEMMPKDHDLQLMLVNTLRKVFPHCILLRYLTKRITGPRKSRSTPHMPRSRSSHQLPVRGRHTRRARPRARPSSTYIVSMYSAPRFSLPLTYAYLVFLFCVRAHVRRRALLAFRALAARSPNVLRHVINKMGNRLRDEDASVVGAALSTCIPLLEVGLSRALSACIQSCGLIHFPF
jgi:AP-4 complex subunit epsilon-1